ncbi:TPA: hypothetical protein ACQ301_004409 [Yersinia enterocolitica]
MKIEPAGIIEPSSSNSEGCDEEFNDLIKKEMKVKEIVKIVRDVSSIKKYKNKRMKKIDRDSDVFGSVLHNASLCLGTGIVIGKKNVKVKARSEFSIRSIIDRSRLNYVIRDLSTIEGIQIEPTVRNISEINPARFTMEKTNSILLLSNRISSVNEKGRILLFPFNNYRLVNTQKQQDYDKKRFSVDYSVAVNMDDGIFKINSSQPIKFIYNANTYLPSKMVFMKIAEHNITMSTNNSLSSVLYHNSINRNYRVFFKGFHYIFKLNGDTISFDKE